ncbi:MAG: cytochrome c biogenesis protein CcsA [Porticoccaceae bacterium]|nr:cytochrome c biogenesis protein CcsA [Pseudomonadales bacterium]MCP5171354.1 cytochrome c biogenesis protein CcsA [Pseudomonadales bacterium]
MTTAAVAIALYLCATLFLGLQLRRHPNLNIRPLLALSCLALLFHAISGYQWIVTDEGFDFGLLPMSSAIFLTMNTIVLFSSLRKPLHNLFLLLFPLTSLVLITVLLSGTPHLSFEPYKLDVPAKIGTHIILSVLSYSVLTIASCQALLLAWQNWRLRHRHLGGWLGKTIPPLQTMEELLFEVLWSGFILLTLSLITGLLFFDDFFAQKLAHKAVFSIIAWLFYGILLWGHHLKGWRGNTAIRLTLSGFIAIALGYWGSKFVLEVLLS